MGNKLYVGNLPYSYRDSDMEQAFSQFGTVSSAKVMMERDTGRSKGFGFVEMGSDAEAQAAIEGMNGQQIGGRGLVVNEARPMEPVLRAAAATAAAAVVAAVTAVVVAAAVRWYGGGGRDRY
jgi:RNA recognition motif-containing protein